MRKWLLLAMVIFMAKAACAQDILLARGFVLERAPAPRLVSPSKEEIDLSNQDYLEFRWDTQGNLFKRSCYEFRLYKGYNAVKDSLILHLKIDPARYSIKIESANFETGQVYTWSVQQVYYSDKSERVSGSFKVIRK